MYTVCTEHVQRILSFKIKKNTYCPGRVFLVSTLYQKSFLEQYFWRERFGLNKRQQYFANMSGHSHIFIMWTDTGPVSLVICTYSYLVTFGNSSVSGGGTSDMLSSCIMTRLRRRSVSYTTPHPSNRLHHLTALALCPKSLANFKFQMTVQL